MKQFYTITENDVGKARLKAFGLSWSVAEFIGHIMSQDVGKRVYRVRTANNEGSILQVENNEQRAVRMASEGGAS